MTLPYSKVLITGASSGLGRGLAAWFAAHGATVYAAARRTDALNSLRTEAGERIVPVTLDVAKSSDTFARVQALDAESGGLDLVIANAGVGGDGPVTKLKWPHIQQMIDVNVSGALATLSGALPGMLERKRGHLVGISSIAALLPLPQLATYSATKVFLSTWLAAMRMEVEPLGLHVTTIQPGFVKSEMTAKNKPGSMPFLLETDDAVKRMASAILRGADVFTFPWQLGTIAKSARLLPDSVIRSTIRKRR